MSSYNHVSLYVTPLLFSLHTETEIFGPRRILESIKEAKSGTSRNIFQTLWEAHKPDREGYKLQKVRKDITVTYVQTS